MLETRIIANASGIERSATIDIRLRRWAGGITGKVGGIGPGVVGVASISDEMVEDMRAGAGISIDGCILIDVV